MRTQSASSQRPTERSEPTSVDGEIKVSTENAAEVAADDSLRAAFSNVIRRIVGSVSVRITSMTPLRRLTFARRTQQNQLAIAFSIDAGSRNEAESMTSSLKSVSRTLWTSEIATEMKKNAKPYNLVVTEVSASASDATVAQKEEKAQDSGLSTGAIVAIVVGACLGLVFAVAIACFLCRRSTMPSKRSRVEVLEHPPEIPVVTKHVKPSVGLENKPHSPQTAWSDASTEASSTGSSFFSNTSDKSIQSVRTHASNGNSQLALAQRPQRQPVTSTQSASPQPNPIVQPHANNASNANSQLALGQRSQLRPVTSSMQTNSPQPPAIVHPHATNANSQLALAQRQQRSPVTSSMQARSPQPNSIVHPHANSQLTLPQRPQRPPVTSSMQAHSPQPNSIAQATPTRRNQTTGTPPRSNSQGARQMPKMNSQPYQQNIQRRGSTRSVSGPPNVQRR